ncbi:MAG: sulfurtransferase [Acidimicrobiales bacterium]
MTQPRGPLVSAPWLSDHLDEVVVVDVRAYFDGRSGHAAYEAGHIEGAVFCDLETDLSDPPSLPGGRHPLPSPGRFAAAMGRLGIGDNSSVVVYDDVSDMVAGRLWWMLDSLGLPVAVLDGGLQAWDAPLATGTPVRDVATFTIRPWPEQRYATADQVMERNPTTVLIDARSGERYAGGAHALDPRAGHIPGAVSAEWVGNIGDGGRFRPTAELADRYGELGIDGTTELIAYCGSGVSACHDLLALRLLGNISARLYVGSWSEWGADPGRPAEPA